MKTIYLFIFVLSLLNHNHLIGQVDSLAIKKEYVNIDEALKNPEKVFRLNLSNQKIDIPSISWDKFVNLEYLSFKNDHLKEVPKEIKNLKKLKVLDLSGNDFKILPKEFSQLSNLEELFLNDEKNLKLEENIEVISLLPHLRILHLENDNLKHLPKNFFKLKSIESLYLNNNFFKEIPVEVRGLNQLNFLDLNNNKIKHELQDIKNFNFGFKINF